MVNAYLIDAQNFTVEQVTYADWKEIAPLIGADYFDVVRIQQNHILYVDDEGLLKNIRHGFIWQDRELVGNALIVGTTQDGRDRDCDLSIEEIQKSLTFFRIMEPV